MRDNLLTAINTAANSGAHSIMWSKELSEAMKSLLKSNNYEVIPNGHAADSSKSYIIRGF